MENISVQYEGSGGSSYGEYRGRRGNRLIIFTKTLILKNAMIDFKSKSGTNSPNIAFVGGAGGGESLFILL